MSLSLVQPFIGQIFDNLRHPLLRDKCLFVTGGWCCVLRLRGVVCQLLLFFRDHLQQLLPPVVGLPSGQIRKLLLLLSKFVGRLRQIFGAICPLPHLLTPHGIIPLREFCQFVGNLLLLSGCDSRV